MTDLAPLNLNLVKQRDYVTRLPEGKSTQNDEIFVWNAPNKGLKWEPNTTREPGQDNSGDLAMIKQLIADQKEAASRGWIGTKEETAIIPKPPQEPKIETPIASFSSDIPEALRPFLKETVPQAKESISVPKNVTRSTDAEKVDQELGSTMQADIDQALKAGRAAEARKATPAKPVKKSGKKAAKETGKSRQTTTATPVRQQPPATPAASATKPAQTRKMMTEAERQAAQAEFVRKTGKPNYLYPPSGAEEAPIVRGFKKFWKNVSQPTTIQSGSQSRGLAAIPDAVSPLTRKAQDPTTIHPTRTIKGW